MTTSATAALLVLGKQFCRNGSNVEMEGRLDSADELFRKGGWDTIIISGGTTRKGLPSEAEWGRDHLAKRGCPAPVVMESSSFSTTENLRNVRALLSQTPNRICIITADYHIPRTKILMRAHWPEIADRVSYVGLRSGTLTTTLCEPILTAIAYFDPYEKYLVSWLKILLRNKLRNRYATG